MEQNAARNADLPGLALGPCILEVWCAFGRCAVKKFGYRRLLQPEGSRSLVSAAAGLYVMRCISSGSSCELHCLRVVSVLLA